MDVNEVSKRKQALEDSITKLLLDFEKETECQIGDSGRITYYQEDMMFPASVQVTVNIPSIRREN